DYFECFACKEMDNCKHDYDYIVVGAGSAGSIIARRLIEDKKIKVLLIEAGSRGNSLLDIPAMGPLLQNSIYDWQYRTVPQKEACLGLEKKVSNCICRGKIMKSN
ncbi:DAO, Lycopene cycl, and/or NAD binding 8 domain containing protein, partial [Asbolus verrucosus]